MIKVVHTEQNYTFKCSLIVDGLRTVSQANNFQSLIQLSTNCFPLIQEC